MDTKGIEQLVGSLKELVKSGSKLETPMIFYSPKSAQCIHARHGSYEEIGGTKQRVGEKFVQFVPMNLDKDGKGYGAFSTTDPDLALFLIERREKIGDIHMQDEYYDLVVPAAERANIERTRRLEVENQLLDHIEKQKAEQHEIAQIRAELAKLKADADKRK